MASTTVANNVSSLAKQLDPYVQKKIDISIDRRMGRGGGNGSGGGGAGGALVAHDISGLFHTGTLANSQAPQFAMLDGSRTYTGDISFPPGGGQTVDGVDISAHAADPNAHHFRATAGDGIFVSSEQEISIEIDPSHGLAFTGAGALTLNVKEGIEVDANALRVDEDYAYTWTAIHTHQNNIHFSGDQFITGTSDLTIDLTGDLLLPETQTFLSDDYEDSIPITGFSLFKPGGSGHINRQLTINSIKTDEFHTRLFVADTVRIDIGEEYWGKSMGIVYADFTTPLTIDGTVTAIFEDSPLMPAAIFSSGDWILIRYLDDSVGFSFGSIWGQVSAYTDLGEDADGRGHQSWTFTLRSGATEQLVKAGNIAVDFGASGQGFVHLSTLESADGPWLAIGEWNGLNPYTDANRSVRTQIGLLDGVGDTELNPAGYGLYSDNAYLHGALRTPETIMDDGGLSLEYPDADVPGLEPLVDQALIGWWPDLNDRSGTSPASLSAHTYVDSFSNREDTLALRVTRQVTSADAALILYAQDPATIGGGSAITLRADETIEIVTGTVEVGAQVVPAVDLTYDLGTASLRWRQLHVDQLFVTGSISGDTLSGAEWEFAGSMIIDAHSASATTVTITNQGTGTASLAVEGSITLGGTVDGVDIAAHDADPSAHHALATAGSGITVSGAQVVAVNSSVVRTTRQILTPTNQGITGGGDLDTDLSLTVDGTVVRTTRTITSGNGLSGGGPLSGNLTLVVGEGDGISVLADSVAVDSSVVRTSRVLTAGAGLSGGGTLAADRAFAVNAGDGLEIAGDDVAVALAANSGLQISTAHLLTMGPPSTLDIDTTNLINVNTHSHAITSTADAYMNPETILHATPAGGLTLANLLVRGAVEISDYGDFTVGNNVLYVINDPDEPSGAVVSRVGILRAPDPQISLDVAGALRADFLYGKIGHQLNHATMIAHYDGRTPIESNFAGEPNGHMGQVASPTGGVIFRPGLFGNKAVQIAEGCLNRVTNPSFELNITTGWSNTATGGTVTQDSEHAYVGTYACKLARSTGGLLQMRTGSIATIGAGSTVCAQMRVWCDGVAYAQMQIYDVTNSVARSSAVSTIPDDWEQLKTFWTNNTGGTVDIRLQFQNIGPDAGANVWCDAVQVETKNYWTPYADGSMGGYSASGVADGTAHDFSGADHGSNTVRTQAAMSYASSGVIDPVHGSVMAWVNLETPTANTQRYLIYHQNGTGRVQVGVTVNNFWFFRLGSSTTRITTALASAGWHHVCLTWNRGASKFYLDGALIDQVSYTPARLNLSATWNLGSDPLDASSILNGYVEDLAWTSDALDAEEIAEIHSSEAPVIAENSVFVFRATPQGRVWADDEGLWMRDVAGLAVAGFYGGDSTKDWGGLSGPLALSPGDILFGRYGLSDGGWLRFDRDGSVGLPLLSLGRADKTVFELTSSAAKLSGVNLEIFNSSDEFFGVFATAPAGDTWAGATGVAAGDVIIGDYDRGGTGLGAAFWWDDDQKAFFVGQPPATGVYFQAGTANAGIRRTDKWRVQLTAAGILRINDSDGNAVFTFNPSAGAEFTRPLTLGTSGGIYQGTGIFAGTVTPGGTIGTGLKIFNSGGVGKLSTYNTGVEQVTLDTDGKLKAGAGNVTLDANGIIIALDSGYAAQRAIEWKTAGTAYGSLTTYESGSTSETRLETYAWPAHHSFLTIAAAAPASFAAQVTLRSNIGGVGAGTLTVGATEAATVIEQLVATAAKPVLRLSQDDLSEEFIEFDAVVAAGNPIDTAALGSYYGKVRVSVNGTFKYMPLYNS